MRPNGPLETKRGHGTRDEAKRGLGGPNEPMKVWMRLLRPNGALEAKQGYGGRDEAVKAKLKAKRGHGGRL